MMTMTLKENKIMPSQFLSFLKKLTAHRYETEEPQIGLEDEIRAIGYHFRKCFMNKTPLPNFIRIRYDKAKLRARCQKMKPNDFNCYLSEGEEEARP